MSSTLGILLAIALVGGTSTAIDRSASQGLQAFLADLPGDFQLVVSKGNASSFRDAVTGVSGVTDLSVWRGAQGAFSIGSPAEILHYPPEVFGVEPDHLPTPFRYAGITGSLDLRRGHVALTTVLASNLRVGLGESVFFESEQFNFTSNQTETYRLNLTVSALLSPRLETSSWRTPPMEQIIRAFIHVQDVDWFEAQLGLPSEPYQIYGEVWIDRARFVDPLDVAQSQRNLVRLKGAIEQAILPYAGWTQDNLSPKVTEYSAWIANQRGVYLLLGVPVVLLGLYLATVGIELGYAGRRREIAIFRARGASSRQLVGFLLVEATLGGVLAGLGGLAAGFGIGQLLPGFPSAAAGDGTLRYQGPFVTPTTLSLTIGLGIGLMALAGYRPAKRAGDTEIVEALRYHPPGEVRTAYRRKPDVILVLLAAAFYGGGAYVGTVSGGIVKLLAGSAILALLPLAPLVLTIGAARLLTQGTGRTYVAASRACKPFARDLHLVIHRNLAQNPRRSANVAVIIALGLAFGVFALTFYESQRSYQVRLVRADVGADLQVFPPSAFDGNFPANLSSISGVAGVTLVSQNPYASPSIGSALVYALEPATYFSVAAPEPWYFLSMSPADAERSLSTSGNVLVSARYLEEASLEVGDSVVLTAFLPDPYSEGQIQQTRVTVAGVVIGLPGAMSAAERVAAIYGSFETFEAISPSVVGSPGGGTLGTWYLVRLQANSDWRAVRQQIYALGAVSVRSFQDELEQSSQDPLVRASAGFITAEVLFIVIVLTVGFGVAMYAASIERDVEFATIVARGASRRQTAALVMGEAFSILIIGLSVGLSVGLLTGYLTVQTFFVAPIGPPESVVPMLFEFSPSASLLLVLAPSALLIAALGVSVRMTRLNVPRVLKLRGG